MTHITEEQLEWIEDATHRAVRKALKRQATGAVIGFLLLFAGSVYLDKSRADQLHDGLVGSCQRVNVLRAQSNGSDLVSFRILSISAQREAKLVQLDKEAAAEHAKSAKSLAVEARRLTVTRLTNCETAVGSPDSYTAPVAGPIGDPTTGELNPGVQQTLNASLELLKQEALDDQG